MYCIIWAELCQPFFKSLLYLYGVMLLHMFNSNILIIAVKYFSNGLTRMGYKTADGLTAEGLIAEIQVPNCLNH